MSIKGILNILYLNKPQFSDLMEKRLKISKGKSEAVIQWPKKGTKGKQTMVNKIPHRKAKTEQHEPN